MPPNASKLIYLRGADHRAQQNPQSPSSSRQAMRVEVFMILKQACPSEWPRGARCVQRFDDSLNSAIHITYRISLRSSSMPEPRDPLLKVLFAFQKVLGLNGLT